jgi:UDP-N-acetylmuramate--alanine ligase
MYATESSLTDYQDTNGRIDDIHLGIPGTHNVENAVAAIAVARLLGIENEAIKKALTTFKGVKRRFEYIVRKPGTVYIDDYAHHPEELRAFLTSMRKLYPTKN